MSRATERHSALNHTMYTLYTAGTPNGHKPSILLEELGLPYTVRRIDLPKGEQREPWYVAINPNGRIPAVIDHGAGDFAIFDSGAILLYLAEKHRALLPSDAKGRSRVTQWLMFQMSGIGPMMGQANVFFRYFPEKIQPAIDRFQGEVRRLLVVLNEHLAGNEYLAGDYSIADIANWCWVRLHFWSGVEIDDLPHLRRWLALVGERPAVKRGVQVPEDLIETLTAQASAEEFARIGTNMIEMGKGRK